MRQTKYREETEVIGSERKEVGRMKMNIAHFYVKKIDLAFFRFYLQI